MPDEIRRTVVLGAARILVNEITAARPQRWEDVLDASTYESVNNWLDIGVTKTGVSEVNDEIHASMSEVNLDKLYEVAKGGPFQLVALWNSSEVDETFHISLRSYPSVQMKEVDEPEVMHEGRVIRITFVRFP
jgi:hypothetical protein